MSKFQPRKGDAVRLIIAGTMDEEWDYVPEHILVRDYDGRLHIVKKNIAHLVPARISQRDADIADAIDTDEEDGEYADSSENNGGWYERGERRSAILRGARERGSLERSGKLINIFTHDAPAATDDVEARLRQYIESMDDAYFSGLAPAVKLDLERVLHGNFYVPTDPTEPNNGEEG